MELKNQNSKDIYPVLFLEKSMKTCPVQFISHLIRREGEADCIKIPAKDTFQS
jgi:hypothetical protein